MSLSELNLKYLQYLAKYPLLTKSVTAGLLGGLNEIVASVYVGDNSEKKAPILSSKTIGLIIYGFFIATPISHNLYKIINQFFLPPLSNKQKAAQIITSLATVTPTMSAAYAGWISLLQVYKYNGKPLSEELKKIYLIFTGGIKKNFKPIFKTSLVVSTLSLIIAQKYISQELWVVFFAGVSFLVGTYLNIKVKQKAKLLKKD